MGLHYRGILDYKDTRYAPPVERPACKPPHGTSRSVRYAALRTVASHKPAM